MGPQVLQSQIYTMSADAISDPAEVSGADFQNIAISLVGQDDDGDDPAVFSVRVLGSTQRDVPDFTSPSVPGNSWSYIQLKDDRTNSYLNGDVGVTFDANATVNLELNTSVLTWVALEQFNYTTGELVAQFTFKNNI